MSPLLVAVFLCVLVTCLIKFMRSRPPLFPPGPPRLPVYGGYLHVLAYNYRHTHKGLAAMAARYKSPVLGMYVGSDPTVIATDFASTREMLLKPEFQGRPDLYAARLRVDDTQRGIFFVEGSFWAEQRRFSLRHIRDYGFGRRSPKLEAALEEEIRTVFDVIRDPIGTEKDIVRDGQVLLPELLNAAFANAMLETLTGERLPRARHETLRAFIRAVRRFQWQNEPSGGVINIAPWMRHLLPGATGYSALVHNNRVAIHFIQGELLSRQMSTHDAEATRGFIDVYLTEMQKRGRDGKSGFTESQLVTVLLDFLFPGTTSPTLTVTMALAHLVRHPEKAERAHQEIVELVGKGRLPTLDDRASLPYTEAILRETLRLETNTPLAGTHRCTEDTYFRGYFVPKGALLIPNIWSANRDPAVFEKGDEFVPERFIDSRTGMLKKKDDSMPFGLGARVCVGETFSRQNMFLFLAALLQNFSFNLSDDGFLPSEDDMIPGNIIGPKSFWLRVTERL